MAGNQVPPQPPPKPPRQANAYDEFGSATRNLPPVAPVAVAIVLVAVVVGILVYINRAKPAAQVSIDGVYFSQPAGMPSPMILIEVTVRNVSDKVLYVKSISAGVKTDQGEQSDDAAAARDYDRYLTAYPDLQGHARPLEVEMKIPPGAEQKGTVLISPSVTKEQFDSRKDLTVTIEPYDQRAIVVHEKPGASK
jgi:hypothetical protein